MTRPTLPWAGVYPMSNLPLEVPMDTTVERSLLHATLDRLGQRARAGNMPPQVNEAALRVLEAVQLLEEAAGVSGGTVLFQGAAPVPRAG